HKVAGTKKKGLAIETLFELARPAGFEPTTPWFVAKYSIQLSYGRCKDGDYNTFFGCSASLALTLKGPAAPPARLEPQGLHGPAQGLGPVRCPGLITHTQALVHIGNRPVIAAVQAGQLVPGQRHGNAHAWPRARRPRGHRRGAEAVAQVVGKDLADAVLGAALGHEQLG